MFNNQVLATDGESAIAYFPKELISAEQYRTITKLADDLNVGADKASQSIYDVPVDELSKSGAADLINYLTDLRDK